MLAVVSQNKHKKVSWYEPYLTNKIKSTEGNRVGIQSLCAVDFAWFLRLTLEFFVGHGQII